MQLWPRPPRNLLPNKLRNGLAGPAILRAEPRRNGHAFRARPTLRPGPSHTEAAPQRRSSWQRSGEGRARRLSMIDDPSLHIRLLRTGAAQVCPCCGCSKLPQAPAQLPVGRQLACCTAARQLRALTGRSPALQMLRVHRAGSSRFAGGHHLFTLVSAVVTKGGLRTFSAPANAPSLANGSVSATPTTFCHC